MSNKKHSGFLGSVYNAGDPDEIAKLYDGWANSYDEEMASAGYRHPSICVALLARHLPGGAEPLLDAGAGTGLIGEWLGILGYRQVEGLDISEGMLKVAAGKGVYSKLHNLALGGVLPFADGEFAGIVSSGVFTTGHVGAEALDELIRICKQDGVIVLTIKNDLWDNEFAGRLAELAQEGAIELIEETVPYVSMPGEAGTIPSRGIVLRIR
ncbi:MAG: class I SAM-dependent DNA methyltransferase [Rhizobiaceae bacterium]